MDGHRLAILIPAYREAETIGPIVAAASAYGTVIVVDDGSQDATGQIAARNGALVIRSEGNLGYDKALNLAFEEAVVRGFTAVVTMDADGEHDPHLLVEFRRQLLEERVPLVLGIRSKKQRISEVVMGVYVKTRFGVDDILCGMKGYDLRLWHENSGFDHNRLVGTELALNSIRRSTPFRQVSVHGSPRKDAPRFDRTLRANWRIFAALMRVVRQDLKQRSRWNLTHDRP